MPGPARQALTYRRADLDLVVARKRSYFVFVMRELSSLFVAWFVVFLLLLLRAVRSGPRRTPTSSTGRPRRGSSALNVVALAFLVLHVVTWFSLTPQAMAVSARRPAVPPAAIIASAVRRPGAWCPPSWSGW